MKETTDSGISRTTAAPIPVVDLFAGPGGLGEGFASLDDGARFEIRLSIEKDPVAYQTLKLRALFRRLKHSSGRVPEAYYQYIRGQINKSQFIALPEIRSPWARAQEEAQLLELGPDTVEKTDSLISSVVRESDDWLLIGGPPCQAYSLAGRSRQTNNKDFVDDERHFLYREYLRVIREHKPAIFVMENVKGLLSSTNRGVDMFARIIDDLSFPLDGVHYEIRSFVTHERKLEPADYVIRSEEHGLPQARHRVVLLGVRSHAGFGQQQVLQVRPAATTSSVLEGLPKIRSRISRNDSLKAWQSVLADTVSLQENSSQDSNSHIDVFQEMAKGAAEAGRIRWKNDYGSHFIATADGGKGTMPDHLWDWLHDPRVGGVIQHEARSHMAADLQRYLFAASYGKIHRVSPTLGQYPSELLPNHRNVSGRTIPFADRFRVQTADRPATTIVAHISKDGHYYIHYDPMQCRSLTVREAARLQTFPDNYFFAGPRTSQYTQVGNAVPPLLASQLARIVASLYDERRVIKE